MPACEECWENARRDAMLLGGLVVDHYRRRIKIDDHETSVVDPQSFTDGSGHWYVHVEATPPEGADPAPDTWPLIPLNDLAQTVLMRRTWQGLTSRDLAAEIGVAPSTITRVEQGKPPTAETYRRLCLWLAGPAGDFHSKKEARHGPDTNDHRQV